MKRYWKIITLAIFAMATIGTLFIQASMATNAFPEFVIKHKSGDQEEVKPLTIISDYLENETTYIRTEISDKGTSYQKNESSYLNLLKEEYFQPEMKYLMKDYRSFMRGKQDTQIHSFFEDQNVLAYVGLKSSYLSTRQNQWGYSFELDVLDQKTKKNTAFELVIPKEEKYNYINIQDVQLINDELKILTVNDLSTYMTSTQEQEVSIDQTEIHIYTVNLDTQKVVNDEMIDVITTELAPDQWQSIYAIDKGRNIGPNKYSVVLVEKNEEAVFNDYAQQTLERQYIVYNLETNQLEEIELPEEFNPETYPRLLSGSVMYLSKEEDNQIEIIGYDLESKQIETKQTFDLSETEGNYFRQFYFMNDKIYIIEQLYKEKVDSVIMIGDIQTGEILYEGTVELADSNKDQQLNKMHINEIQVKKE